MSALTPDSAQYQSSQELNSTTQNNINLSAGDNIVNTFVYSPPLKPLPVYVDEFKVPAVMGGKGKSVYEIFYKNNKFKVSTKNLVEASKISFDVLKERLFKKIPKEWKKKTFIIEIRKFNPKRENKLTKFKITMFRIKHPKYEFKIDIKKV